MKIKARWNDFKDNAKRRWNDAEPWRWIAVLIVVAVAVTALQSCA